MACPDWYFVPTCNGELFPEMTGGVLYEHGHRLWATWVGLLTIALTAHVWMRRRDDATSRKLALVALALVCLQGALGGITVLLNLSSAVSTLHLGMAMLFFGLVTLLAFRLAPGTPAVPADRAPSTARRGLVLVTGLVVYGQILLGGLVRHLGAGLICGDDWIGCGPDSSWMQQGLAHLHMTHRYVAYALIALVFFACRHAAAQAREHGRVLAGRLAWLPFAFVGVQVVLGLLTVATRSVPVMTLHTGVAALVLISLWAVYLALGPLGARIDARGSNRS